MMLVIILSKIFYFYLNLCSCTVSCNKHFVVASHRNTFKYQKALGSRSELPISLNSQMFLRSIDIDFVEKVSKSFLSVDIPLYKVTKKNIKILFRDW